MKGIQYTGLVLFIVGFIAFNSILLFDNFTLTSDVINRQITDTQKQQAFHQAAESILDKDYTFNVTFVAAIKNTLQAVNQQQLNTYAINLDEVNRIIQAHSNLTFSLATIDSVFNQNTPAHQFKKKAFYDYGSWLNDRAFTSQVEMKTQVETVVDNIAKYQIISQFGFDRYQTKDLVYSITKASSHGVLHQHKVLTNLFTIGLCIVGALLYFLPKLKTHAGIKNDGIFTNPMKNGGWLGILTGTWLIAFYIILYFYPEYMTAWVAMVDPISLALNGHEAGRFFLYGFLYTLCILVMGVRMIIHYRHSKYQMLRTASVMFFQTAFAFLIPELLVRLNKPYFDFKNIWPLDYSFFFNTRLDELIAQGSLGLFMLGWGIALIIIAVPVFVYFFGKRWYCSWVCGCGGLAETLGDPYRHRSSKKLIAWKIERYVIHGVLVFAVLMTAAVLYTYFTNDATFFFIDSYKLREVYGAYIGAGFAGVIGTGFYPLMGNRVWCRFGCPLAAYLGIIQRFKSRFRITTNGGQCISCGNCSTYCEMGIDVRWYAQRGQDVVRASCVGCGICSAVCPRGVLNLETLPKVKKS